MKPGSVVVDLASETGGNVETTVKGEVITTDNVGSAEMTAAIMLAPTHSSKAEMACGPTCERLLQVCPCESIVRGALSVQGVICVGLTNMPSRLPTQSSTL